VGDDEATAAAPFWRGAAASRLDGMRRRALSSTMCTRNLLLDALTDADAIIVRGL